MSSNTIRREVNDIPRLVREKLELYINYERRENRFDPQGVHRTTPRMATYDYIYKVLEQTELEKEYKKKQRKETQNKKELPKGSQSPYSIEAKLNSNSRRVVGRREVHRLTANASQVLESVPLEKLYLIHRYRPKSGGIPLITDTGKIQNYNRHVGCALHSESYIKYYKKQGLDSGSCSASPRLQKLAHSKRLAELRQQEEEEAEYQRLMKEEEGQKETHDYSTCSEQFECDSEVKSTGDEKTIKEDNSVEKETGCSDQELEKESRDLQIVDDMDETSNDENKKRKLSSSSSSSSSSSTSSISSSSTSLSSLSSSSSSDGEKNEKKKMKTLKKKDVQKKKTTKKDDEVKQSGEEEEKKGEKSEEEEEKNGGKEENKYEEEDLRKKEEDREREEDEKKREEEEKKEKEAKIREEKNREEEKKKEEEKKRADEKKRQEQKKEEEKQRKREEEQKRQEEERKRAEERKKEEEKNRKVEEQKEIEMKRREEKKKEEVQKRAEEKKREEDKKLSSQSVRPRPETRGRSASVGNARQRSGRSSSQSGNAEGTAVDDDKKDTVSYTSVEYTERTNEPAEQKRPLIRSISNPPFQSLMGGVKKSSFQK